MIYPQLHFTGQVWRPPYEAGSQLLQITSGCTWHKCKFCSLYHGTPFRMSPLSEVEEDLKVIRQWQPRARRVYLTGANPFALSYSRLHPCIINIVSLTIFPESQLFQKVVDGSYEEEPEIERLIEIRTLIDRLKIKVNLLGHHISNTIPVTGALPYDKAVLLHEFDKAIAEFPEEELKAYRNRIWHL
ncbi:MAG: hypothetical protein K2G49_04810 [Muribaculum sp.]|nr:hypothetical protein [Muribaculum sp.]